MTGPRRVLAVAAAGAAVVVVATSLAVGAVAAQTDPEGPTPSTPSPPTLPETDFERELDFGEQEPAEEPEPAEEREPVDEPDLPDTDATSTVQRLADGPSQEGLLVPVAVALVLLVGALHLRYLNRLATQPALVAVGDGRPVPLAAAPGPSLRHRRRHRRRPAHRRRSRWRPRLSQRGRADRRGLAGWAWDPTGIRDEP